MIRFIPAALIVAGAAFCTTAHSTSREETMQRIEAVSLRASTFAPDSPFVEMFLQMVRPLNPSVSPDDFNRLKPELSAAMTEALTRHGGLLSTYFRLATQGLSDAELEHLDVLLEDPVFVKFQGAMSKPDIQRALLRTVTEEAPQLMEAFNKVLAAHGLNTVSLR